VGRDEDRGSGGGHFVDQVPELPAGDRVDARGGLVEEEDGRFVQDGAAEREPLLPAAGEGARQGAPLLRQAGHPEDGIGPLRQPCRRHAIDAAEEFDVFPDREIVVERELLGHIADGLLHVLGLAGDIEAVYFGPPGSRRQQAAQNPDRGRLPRPVRPQEAEDFAAPDVERDVVDGDEATEALDQVFGPDGDVRVGHAGPPPASRAQ